MEHNKSVITKRPLTMVFIVLLLLFWHDHHKLSSIIDDQHNQISTLEYEKSSYEDALEEANSNIEEAKWYAWESYQEMGDALDYLETVNP